MINSIIGITTSLKGEFEVNGSLRIDGYFEGSITGNSSILIGEKGTAHFQLEGKDIIIGGNVKGHIKLTGKAVILATGSLDGSIQASSIEIEPGGVVHGTCRIRRVH